MHQHKIEIAADDQPTVLERLLQVTRYRGFSIINLNVLSNTKDQQLDIELTVQSTGKPISEEHNIQRLYNQLNKLFDIKHVNLVPLASEQKQA